MWSRLTWGERYFLLFYAFLLLPAYVGMFYGFGVGMMDTFEWFKTGVYPPHTAGEKLAECCRIVPPSVEWVVPQRVINWLWGYQAGPGIMLICFCYAAVIWAVKSFIWHLNEREKTGRA